MINRLVKGLGALAVLTLIIVGVPWGLIFLAGNPIPSVETLQGLLTRPDYGGSFLLGSLLPMIAWVAWASFMVSILTVLPAAIRGVRFPQIRGLGMQQRAASVLVGAVIALLAGFGGVGAANAAEPVPTGVSISASAAPQTIAEAEQVQAAAAAAQTVAGHELVSVTEGDTLWGIAEDRLGDASRWPELFEATKNVDQPDGLRIVDPNVILPGWQIAVPTANTAPVMAPPEASTPAPEAPSVAQAPVEAPQEALTPAQAPEAAPAPVEAAPGAEEVQSGSEVASTDVQGQSTQVADEAIIDNPVVRTSAGVGALLAASLLSFIGIKRFQQRRKRKIGERMVMPAPELTTTELELRSVENPKGVDDVDRALRFLAHWAGESGSRLPKLFALRLSAENVEIYLTEPMDLPAPFVASVEDRSAWVIDPAELPVFDPRPVAPYPGLVTLGQDASDGHIMVDVEQIGALAINGPDQAVTEGALTALAVELACSQWADDLQVTVVGFAPELATAFKTGRVQYLDDVQDLMSSLRSRARAYRSAFKDEDVEDISHARVASEADTWTPEIVLLGELPDERVQLELAALIQKTPRVGIAAISNGRLAGDWALTIDHDLSAMLSPAGIPIKAQVLMGRTYEQVLQTIAATDQPAQAASPASDTAEVEPVTETIEQGDEPLAVEQPVDAAVSSDLAAGDEVEEEVATEVSDQLATTQTKIQPATAPLPSAPIVRLLDGVRIDGAEGIEPRTAKASYIAGCSSIVAYMALHPGASREELHQAIWPNERHDETKSAGKRNQYISRARRWLATDPEGENYLPLVAGDSHSLHPEVATDWHLFRSMIGVDISRASTENLAGAMELVKKQPFAGAPARWFSYADLDKQEMIDVIVDVAHELVDRALLVGDVSTARRTAAKAMVVDPASEIPVRDRLRAEAAAKDWPAFDAIYTDLTSRLEEMESEPDEETVELVDQLSGRLRLAG